MDVKIIILLYIDFVNFCI